jgi:Mg-chelatase subunit ChlD
MPPRRRLTEEISGSHAPRLIQKTVASAARRSNRKRKVVDELMARLQYKRQETLRGALNRSQRTRRPRHADIDWPRTIGANLRHYQTEHGTIVPETLIGHSRASRTQANLDHVVLCVDQSGSMASSVVYASIFAAVMASVPGLSTQLICLIQPSSTLRMS